VNVYYVVVLAYDLRCWKSRYSHHY